MPLLKECAELCTIPDGETHRRGEDGWSRGTGGGLYDLITDWGKKHSGKEKAGGCRKFVSKIV